MGTTESRHGENSSSSELILVVVPRAHVSKFTELYALHGHLSLHINHTLKLFQHSKKDKEKKKKALYS